MVKKSKVSTPDWILEGYDSKADWEKAHGISSKKKKGKTFKIRECPKCGSRKVSVVLGQEENKGKGEWKCYDCKWVGVDVVEKELDEQTFMKYLDEKGEEVA